MKELKIDAAIRRDSKLLKVVEDVTGLLEHEIGHETSEITAEWSIAPQKLMSERLIKLEISDRSDSSSFVFSEGGLTLIAGSGPRISLIRIWGDLLQARSHRQVENLKLIVQGLGQESR